MPRSRSTLAQAPRFTVPDCHLDGAPIALDRWANLSSSDLARLVGLQQPGGALENAQRWTWAFQTLPLERLRHASEDLDEPDGGWAAAYLRYLAHDARAIAEGSPEYAGRDAWIRDVWGPCTAIHPLFVVVEPACADDGQVEDGYRLLDGYRRLGGAFHHGLSHVSVVLGTPR